MVDYISRKKFEKKVLDRWENEGGTLPPYERKLAEINLPSEDKLKKNRQSQLADAFSDQNELVEL